MLKKCAAWDWTTVTLISASLSFWIRWHWQDRNSLRCKKRWKSLGARSRLQGGWWLGTSQLNSCMKCVDCQAVCGLRCGTADEFQSPHSSTFLSLHLRHNSFSNPSVALPTSQLILLLIFCFFYVTGSSLTSPGEPPMPLNSLSPSVTLIACGWYSTQGRSRARTNAWQVIRHWWSFWTPMVQVIG